MRGRNYSARSMLERMFTNSVRLVGQTDVIQKRAWETSMSISSKRTSGPE